LIKDTQGNYLFSFGREGTGSGEFKQPKGIVTDQQGYILVADSGNSRVQAFKNDGTYVAQFGSHGSDSGKFKAIEGLTLAANGDVIICDKENHRIQIL
jgi:DNA-binding beta-propeller fold protein YncE